MFTASSVDEWPPPIPRPTIADLLVQLAACPHDCRSHPERRACDDCALAYVELLNLCGDAPLPPAAHPLVPWRVRADNLYHRLLGRWADCERGCYDTRADLWCWRCRREMHWRDRLIEAMAPSI